MSRAPEEIRDAEGRPGGDESPLERLWRRGLGALWAQAGAGSLSRDAEDSEQHGPPSGRPFLLEITRT